MSFSESRHVALQKLKLSKDRKTEIELTQLALQRATVMTGDEVWRLGNISQELMKTSGIDVRIDGDDYAELAKKLDDDRKAAEATKAMLMELVSNLPGTSAAGAGATYQDHCGQITFGDYNSGLQSRVINGGVHGGQFGGR